MNVTCTGCPAKYAVPDEKVRGKKVRITCKHCGTNIVVDGTTIDGGESLLPKPAVSSASQPTAPAAPSIAPALTSVQDISSAPPKAVAEAKPRAAAEVAFIVGFPDDRQETHALSQIVDMYSSGKIDDEALVWKDGMPDWLSPFEVPELAAAFRAKGVARRPTATPGFAAVAEDEATLIVRSPMEELQKELAAAAASAAPAAIPPSPTPAAGNPPPAVTAGKPAEESMFGKPVAAAARRVEKRAGAVDLFGGVAAAGSEGDVSLDLAGAEEPAHKLTGARNESSVLFSLDALTKPDPKAKAKKATEKENEREASAALFGESAPDSLMNLGGGGLSALAAPDFTKPVSVVAQPVRLSTPLELPDIPANKGRGGLVLFITFVVIAAVAGGAFVMMKKQNATEAVAVAPSAATPVQTATPSAPETAETPNAAASGATASSAAPTDSSASPSASATSASAAGAKPTPPPAPGAAATPAVAGAATPAAKPTEPSEPAAATKKPDAVEAPAEGAAFDKNAAVAALGAAAASAGSCKNPDGPVGSGKVSVTFAPSGRATATNVAGELAGTEVGGCVARLFRTAKVPPFSGDPVTVTKSFSIQ